METTNCFRYNRYQRLYSYINRMLSDMEHFRNAGSTLDMCSLSIPLDAINRICSIVNSITNDSLESTDAMNIACGMALRVNDLARIGLKRGEISKIEPAIPVSIIEIIAPSPMQKWETSYSDIL